MLPEYADIESQGEEGRTVKKRKLVVLGCTGMIGHTLFRKISGDPRYQVIGTTRSLEGTSADFTPEMRRNIRTGVNLSDFSTIEHLLVREAPDTVINCIGITKQQKDASPLAFIETNTALPHRVAEVCARTGARMVQMSTDCVFSGSKGNYDESDVSDAVDLYGRTKFLGEVTQGHCLTIRTSLIGRELGSQLGLLEWFLGQKGETKGFTKAIFSGLTTNELAKVFIAHILPDESLTGLYHISSLPLSKFDLITLVARIFKKEITIHPSEELRIDRSLDGSKFASETGYAAPPWTEMIEEMRADVF